MPVNIVRTIINNSIDKKDSSQERWAFFVYGEEDFMFKILALDQASKTTGWAIATRKGVKKSGLIKVDPDLPYLERLRLMREQIQELIWKTNPSYVVFEDIQYQRNASAFQILGMLQGIIIAELFDNNLDFFIVPSVTWKSYCGIKGKNRMVQKENSIKYVLEKYGREVTDDEADAIGIADWALANVEEDK